MKFLFDDDENEGNGHEDGITTPADRGSEADELVCASNLFSGESGECVVAATKGGNIITYSLAGGQLKVVGEVVVRRAYQFDYISVSRRGEVIILSENNCQQLYIVNKYSLSSEEGA